MEFLYILLVLGLVLVWLVYTSSFNSNRTELINRFYELKKQSKNNQNETIKSLIIEIEKLLINNNSNLKFNNYWQSRSVMAELKAKIEELEKLLDGCSSL